MHEGADSWVDVVYHVLEWVTTWGWAPLAGLGLMVLLAIGLKTGNWPWRGGR